MAAMVLTAAMIASATAGYLRAGDASRAIDGFAIDSRTLQPGDLFFAIVAVRDGHEFVGDALAHGAIGAVIASAEAEALTEGLATSASAGVGSGEGPGFSPGNHILIEVPDTTAALQDLARFVRRESSATVVAITGSAGKTTTKETIAAFLSGRYRVVKNKGNLNNHLGLPLSLLELRHGADVAVMELGMNHAGELRLLVGIAEPRIRVWSNVGDAHLGYFASREMLADAKAEILENASPADVIVVNADDPLVMARAPRFAGRTITFGLSSSAAVRAEAIEDRGLAGMRFQIRTAQDSVSVAIPLVGRGNLMNILAAAAVALEFGVPLSEIASRASRLMPAPHRGAVIRLRRGVTLFDDSYNSSPAALERALDAMTHERGAARKAAVLGEMLELGDHAVGLHEHCGRRAAASGLDRLIAVGGVAAEALANAAVAAGMPPDTVSWSPTSVEAASAITSWLQAGDVVLVKGSRGVRTDRVVDRITAEFS
jgi:UDP-N-acetylmuramoyl-tripeptide--D-alanyl-D-alanine ligase